MSMYAVLCTYLQVTEVVKYDNVFRLTGANIEPVSKARSHDSVFYLQCIMAVVIIIRVKQEWSWAGSLNLEMDLKSDFDLNLK